MKRWNIRYEYSFSVNANTREEARNKGMKLLTVGMKKRPHELLVFPK